MFFGPILPYLKPHSGRIVFALVCMVISSFLGTYNIVLSRPALDLLFGQTNCEEREANTDREILDRLKKLKKLEATSDSSWKSRMDLKRKSLYYPLKDKIYARIFGSSFFVPNGFDRPADLLRLLESKGNPTAEYLWSNLDPKTTEMIVAYNKQVLESGKDAPEPSSELMDSLTQDLNSKILGKIEQDPNVSEFKLKGPEFIYTPERFPVSVFSYNALKNLVDAHLSPQISSSNQEIAETRTMLKHFEEIQKELDRTEDEIGKNKNLSFAQQEQAIRSAYENALKRIGEFLSEQEMGGKIVQTNRNLLTAVFPTEFEADPPRSLYRYASKDTSKSLRWIGAFIILNAFLYGLFEYGFKYNISYTLYRSVIELKNDIFRHILNQDMRFFTERSVGFLMSRITSDVETIGTVFDVVVKNALDQSVRLIFLFSLLMFLNPTMTGVVFFLIIPLFIVLGWFAHLIKHVSRKQKSKRDVLSAAMNESLGNVRLIKALATEEIECGRFNQHNERVFHYQMKQRVAKFAASPIMEIMAAFGMAAILIWGGSVVIHGQMGGHMEPSEFIIYVITLGLFYTPIKRISRVNVNWQLGVVSCERIQEIMTLRATILEPEAGIETPRIEHVEKGIAVRNVTFSYDERVILDNVSVDFPKGSITAIVGRSGSGKTTLANLLLRLYDPDEGMIGLDGYDIRTFRKKDLRAHFGIVTQETILFDDTVANNIAYGAPDVDRDRIMEAARIANAHEFIMALEKGYDTVVGPAGSTLSGGQRQRIAIARAFYRNPDILLLDEATSSLDTESETVVQEAIEPLMKDRTVIVIAHRLSTIMHADNIIVLHEGKVVEQGSHSDLLELQGHYATLYRLGEFSEKENGNNQSA